MNELTISSHSISETWAVVALWWRMECRWSVWWNKLGNWKRVESAFLMKVQNYITYIIKAFTLPDCNVKTYCGWPKTWIIMNHLRTPCVIWFLSLDACVGNWWDAASLWWTYSASHVSFPTHAWIRCSQVDCIHNLQRYQLLLTGERSSKRFIAFLSGSFLSSYWLN